MGERYKNYPLHCNLSGRNLVTQALVKEGDFESAHRVNSRLTAYCYAFRLCPYGILRAAERIEVQSRPVNELIVIDCRVASKHS